MKYFIFTFLFLMLHSIQLHAQRKVTFGFNSGYLSAAFNKEVDLYTDLPAALKEPEKIYALSVSANTKNLAEVKNLTNLKFLYLDESFVSNSFYLSDDALDVFFKVLSQLENLEYISCYDGKLLSRIQNLPHIIGLKLNQVDPQTLDYTSFSFKTLDILILNDPKLQYIPSGISKFKTIRQLEIYCIGLTQLNTPLGALENVEVMKLMTGKVERIEFSFNALQKLRYLSITGLTSFFKFPSNIFMAKNIVELHLDIRTAHPVPNEISSLKNLRVLGLHECQLVRNLPDSLYLCKNIEEIYLSDANFMSDVNVLNKIDHPYKLFMNRCDYLDIAKDIASNKNLKAIVIPASTQVKTINKLNEILTTERVLLKDY